MVQSQTGSARVFPGVWYRLPGDFCSSNQTGCTPLAMAGIKGWDMQQLDIKRAYLHCRPEEEIFMTHPPGFETDPRLVCKLIHSLYGLKQSGRAWYLKFRDVLSKYGFHQLEVEHCLYKQEHNSKTQIISAWTADLIFIGDDSEETADKKQILSHEFEVHNLGKP